MENINLSKVLDDAGYGMLAGLALQANRKEADRILDTYERDWNEGGVFDPISQLYGKQRTAENEAAEMEAMIAQVKQQLEAVVLDHWAAGMSCEQALAVCNALFSLLPSSKIVVEEIEINAYDLQRHWNKTHPDERPIYPEPGFEN